MYRTLDTYTIKLSQPIHWAMIEAFDRMLEKHNLLADFRECLDELAAGKFHFTTSCTYKSYKRFFLILFEAFGPFKAEVSFNEDYPPEGCGYNTMVNFEVDEVGNYVYALLNILSTDPRETSSKEYNRRRRNPMPPFEANCKKEGSIYEWDCNQFAHPN